MKRKADIRGTQYVTDIFGSTLRIWHNAEGWHWCNVKDERDGDTCFDTLDDLRTSLSDRVTEF